LNTEGIVYYNDVPVQTKDGQAIDTDIYMVDRATLLQCNIRDITERRQAEETLQDSRNMLQTVLDSIPSAVFWKNRDSIYLGGNRTWLEAVGLKSSEEVVGKRDYDLQWEKEQTDKFREDNRRVMESGIPEYGITEPYLRADGAHAWARTNKVPLRDKEGNVTGVLGTYEDITEHVQAEQSLRESEERFRAIYEQAAVGVAQIETKTGRFLRANQKYCDIVGRTREEMAGATLKEITHPDDLKLSLDNIQELVRGNIRDCNYEKRYVRKDGSVVWVSLTISPMWRVGEKPNYHIAVVEDITDRKKAEEALRDAKEGLDKAQKLAHIGNWSRDLNFNYVQWSDELYRIFGLTPGDPAEISFEFFLSRILPEDRERVTSTLKEAAEKKQAFDFEYRTVPIEGSERIIRVHGEIECDETGAPVRFFGTNQDITETRRLQSQLQQAHKMEAIGTMAGGIAHDFNNILSIILGNAELACIDVPDSNPVSESLKEIHRAAIRATDMVHQLLAFSRKTEEENKPINMAPIIHKRIHENAQVRHPHQRRVQAAHFG